MKLLIQKYSSLIFNKYPLKQYDQLYRWIFEKICTFTSVIYAITTRKIKFQRKKKPSKIIPEL